jgi:glycosyltransferase involved in cell wall biosynthesis
VLRVLVNLEYLPLGGSIITAIELAAAVQEQFGDRVFVYGEDGPAAPLARERGLEVITPPAGRSKLAYVRSLHDACRRLRPDVVHCWDWAPIIVGYYAAQVMGRVPVLGSVSDITVPPFLPHHIPITFVTDDLRRLAEDRAGPNLLQDMPINAHRDRADMVDAEAFAAESGLRPETTHVVLVSRLARYMKLESTLTAIDAVSRLADHHDLDLVIVGDGDARATIDAAADAANERLGRSVVRVLGPMVDPRPAYAVADIAIGMGSSILRGMSFEKAAVVLGEDGFSEIFTPETADSLMDAGFYGLGDGVETGPERLAAQLERLLVDRAERDALAAFGRRTIEKRFDVTVVASALHDQYVALARDGLRPTPLATTRNVASTAVAGLVLAATKKVPLAWHDGFWLRAHQHEPDSRAGKLEQYRKVTS